MKIDPSTLSPAQIIPGSEKATSGTAVTRVMTGQTVTQGETVSAKPPAVNNGAPDIPEPEETAQVDNSGFGDGQSFNIQDLLMWIANMAAEYIKQQGELLKTRQKAVEAGFNASLDAAQNNYEKNMTQAIVGIVGASVSLAGAGFSAVKLAGVATEVKGLSALSGEPLGKATTTIDNATQIGQTANAIASGVSSATNSIGGAVSAGQELDAKKQEALSQLIAKTAESISSNEGSARQIIEKFVNDLMAMLKNFYASTTR